MKSLWFIVPAHGRVNLARVCLRQLARTCSDLQERGLHASAVVIAADENLDSARELGFATIQRANKPLGRKWNDGYELAGREGVDYVVPFGTDDWIDADLVHQQLPEEGEMRCSRLSAVVSEDGRRLSRLRIPYEGGDGIRILPTSLLRPLSYRPAEEDRPRAIDTNIMQRLNVHKRPTLRYFDLHPLQIVDWKSADEQLNGYEACRKYQEGVELDPWRALVGVYPSQALDEMRAAYRLPAEVTA